MISVSTKGRWGGTRRGAGRLAEHQKTSAHLRLDVRHMQRCGTLVVGTARTWRWSTDPPQEISARIEAGPIVRLMFRHRAYRSDWQRADVRVRLTQSLCRYGGSRYWFACPCCGGRVAILYIAGAVGCRKCFCLRYPSQSKNPIDRSWAKQREIERRLSKGTGKWYIRPKGMHETTFQRLIFARTRLEYGRDLALISLAKRWGIA